MTEEFLQDPLSFRHFIELRGASSFASLIKGKYLQGEKAGLAASLMCGSGWQDRLFHGEGLFDRMVGFDDDKNLLKLAQSMASERCFDYLPSSKFTKFARAGAVDLIYGYGRLDRAQAMREGIEGAHRALRPGGVFAALVATRSKTRIIERDVIRDLLKSVPTSLRNTQGNIDDTCLGSANLLAGTSRESISEIVENVFSNVDVIELGGTLSFPIWHLTRGKLDYNIEQHVALILMSQVMEHSLIQNRIIESNFAIVIGRK